MKKLTLAYFGTPSFSAYFLEKLLTDKTLPIKVKFVVTQPDKPVGRKQILTPSPVKKIAVKNKIPVVLNVVNEETFQEAEREDMPQNLKEEKNYQQQNLLKTVDIALVLAYGQIIPKKLLNLPKYGFWNIHFSLLPKYRGPSPVAYALMAGEKKTGVTIFKMDEKIDHGPIIDQKSLTIKNSDKRDDLEKKLTDLGFLMFKKIISTNLNQLKLTPQAHHLATYTKKLTKEDGFISFEDLKLKIKNSPEKIFNLFRGLSPWPGIWTILPKNNKRLKITQLTIDNQRLIIKRVQLEGKKEVDFKTFTDAYKIL